ncbi:hypothetical protein MFLAVUS_007645 [Mucor flavus]|uniref:Ubiquinone biosynthesis protein n=1 Tax=Mucor flavus TaxID=439312 RepID=A0ABP9Z518_9FUNG
MSALRPLIVKALRTSTLRTCAIRSPARVVPAYQTRNLASTSEPTPMMEPKEEQDPRVEILKATMPFVAQYGWTMESLMQGAKSLGYPSVAHGVFPGGVSGLIDAHLAYSREQFVDLTNEKKEELKNLPMNERVKVLTALRLDMNKPYIQKWPEALAVMAQPSNVNMSLKHLGDIADDIWYYAGDKSADMNWYTRRASLAAIYSAADIFMTQDVSPNYTETERFLERRLNEAAWIGSSTRQLGTMLTFGAKSMASALANRGGAF